MLTLILPRVRGEWDDEHEYFVNAREERRIHLEHSLFAMAEWEGIEKLCFMATDLNTLQFSHYIQCMAEEELTLSEATELQQLYYGELVTYIYDSRCAKRTQRKSVNQNAPRTRPKFTPTEEIYSVMFKSGVPVCCEKWHFSRLCSLIQYMNKKGKKGKKGSASMSTSSFNRMMQMNDSRLNGGG